MRLRVQLTLTLHVLCRLQKAAIFRGWDRATRRSCAESRARLRKFCARSGFARFDAAQEKEEALQYRPDPTATFYRRPCRCHSIKGWLRLPVHNLNPERNRNLRAATASKITIKMKIKIRKLRATPRSNWNLKRRRLRWFVRRLKVARKWSERQDLNLRRLGPKPSALARLSYAPTSGPALLQNLRAAQ